MKRWLHCSELKTGTNASTELLLWLFLENATSGVLKAHFKVFRLVLLAPCRVISLHLNGLKELDLHAGSSNDRRQEVLMRY